jgi:hypothetical protein
MRLTNNQHQHDRLHKMLDTTRGEIGGFRDRLWRSVVLSTMMSRTMANRMMSGLSSTDAQLLQIASEAAPATIADVVAVMESIDAILPSSDGLKWFNRLYLMVTQQVDMQPPAGGWKDANWLTRLDIVFAGFYFSAIADGLSGSAKGGSAKTANAWDALFEARNRSGIDRIQFALAGMNAHINHDLALALLQTDEDLGLALGIDSPEHDDYESVNGLLEKVLPAALTFLANGVLGELAQDTGKVGRLLAIWNVSAARDLAWGFADHLRNLTGVDRDDALDAQDQLTGVIGRSLLLPI